MSTCQYNTQPGNVPCGAPATHSYVTGGRRRLLVCKEHAEEVWRATRHQVDPTPLVKTVMVEKGFAPITTAPGETVENPVPGAVDSVRADQLEQLRRFRERLAGQGEGDKP